MEVEFDDIKFIDDGERVKAKFLRIFEFYIEYGELKKIGDFRIEDGKIVFPEVSDNKFHKFDKILAKGFDELRNSLNGNKTVYIHQNSGIPLIGHVSFGIVDRNTNLIEVKPITSCNLKCIYCSVREDVRPVDFVIEDDYLVDEIRKLIEYKGCDDIEIHIGCQGEPLRYEKLDDFVRKVSRLSGVKRISIDTNGTMLTREKIDSLIEAGITRFNISVDALDKKLASYIACTPYNLDIVLDAIRYIASKDVEFIIVPLWLPNINDKEIEKIIEFVLSFGKKQKTPLLGIQKYLKYRYGRKMKEVSWEKFYSYLRELEEKYGTQLVLSGEDFEVFKTKTLEKPFRKGDVVRGRVVSEGRLKDEKIVASGNRVISVFGECSGDVKVKITKEKHNIFKGTI